MQFFLIISLAFWPLEASVLKKSAKEFRQAYQNPDDPLPDLLNDVLSGALEGRGATLMVNREGLDFPQPLDPLIRSLRSPVAILRLPKDLPDNSNNSELDFRNSSFEGPLDLGDAVDDSKVIPLFQSVLIILYSCDDWFGWPFWKPPAFWSAVGVLVVSTCPSCWKDNILEYPLLEKASSLTFICPNAQRKSVPAKLGYKVSTWLPFASGRKFVDLGPWNLSSFDSWNKLFTDRFQDLGEMTLHVKANNYDVPVVYTAADGKTTGQSYRILEHLSEWIHFKIEATFSVDLNWNQLLDMVRREETDIMINFLSATPERNEDFQITIPYHFAGFGVMLRVPPSLPQWRNIYYPFSWQVWGVTILSTVAAGLVFRSLNYQEGTSTFSDVIIPLMSLLSEPVINVPFQWRLRLFLLLWWLTSWVITISYSTNLIAILTVPVFPRRIQTLQELAESNYRLCMLDYGEFVPEALATSTNSILSSLGKKMDLVPWILDLPIKGFEGCVDRVMAGTHSHTEGYPFIELIYGQMNFSKDVYALREYLYSNHLIFIIHKHSPLKQKFNEGMRRLLEIGLTQKWYQEALDDLVKKQQKDVLATTQQNPLTLDDLQGQFYLLLCGLSICTCAFVLEMFTPAT